MNPALLMEVKQMTRKGMASSGLILLHYSLCCVMERTAGFLWVSLQTLAPWRDHVNNVEEQ